MADKYRKTTTFHGDDDDQDLLQKCRERRKRRIERRRRGGGFASGSSSGEAGDPPPPPPPPAAAAEEEEEVVVLTPQHGVMSVAGRMREMEDAVNVCMNLCRPEISQWLPVHFFAVYDGHGGSHVATLCKERLHVLLQEELMRVGVTPTGQRGDSSNSQEQGQTHTQPQHQHHVAKERENGVKEEEGVEEYTWRVVMKRAFERMDDVALTTCACGAAGFSCGCHPVTVALAGSTATVAVVTPRHIVVANCGDSRAVLSRGRHVIPLSVDHKPDRPDELARIEAAGGRVIFLKGARVQGILAMSRAIGDKFLKPLVISEPEVTITKRDPEDECLILASDGLWDVISSDMACKVACQCLREENRTSPEDVSSVEHDEGLTSRYPSPSSLAAALLTRLALGRESSDNISVIVVDLKR